MAPHYREFDRSRIQLRSLKERIHDFDHSGIVPLTPSRQILPSLTRVADRIRQARQKGAAVVVLAGAHVLRSGVQRYLIDLMDRGLITCLALNGAGVIHDFELALIGATTESVARYVKDGQFGLWSETGRLNDIVSRAAKEQKGLAEAVGQVIYEENFPYRDLSVLAAGYRLDVLVTAHVHLGCDIVHEHPNCDGAAYGATTYRDFLRLTAELESLEGGVVMNFGSAVMGPEVFLKALTMVRNVAAGEGQSVSGFTTLVCDLVDLPEDTSTEANKADPHYYFRPWKTMLVRTVAEGGESYYVRARHAQSIPELWTALTSAA